MNKAGFTIIELLVVITIIGILFAIAIPAYNRWTVKYSVENDVKQMYSFLQKFREKAFAEKKEYVIQFPSASLSGKNLQVLNGATVEDEIKLNTVFKFSGATNNITISRRGVFNQNSIYSLKYNFHPQFSCLVISRLRVRMGKWNDVSGDCDVQ